jgi:hypothetical protein
VELNESVTRFTLLEWFDRMVYYDQRLEQSTKDYKEREEQLQIMATRQAAQRKSSFDVIYRDFKRTDLILEDHRDDYNFYHKQLLRYHAMVDAAIKLGVE